MAADPAMWEAFFDWCEREIAERREQLAPLEAGQMHMGRRGPDTGFQWQDVTELQAERLRNEIKSLQNTLDRTRKEHAQGS